MYKQKRWVQSLVGAWTMSLGTTTPYMWVSICMKYRSKFVCAC